MDPEKHYSLAIHPGKLALLKYKCLTCIMALLEGNDQGDNFLLRIIRGIPLPIMTENLLHLYMIYDKYKSKDEYEIGLFGRYNQTIDPGQDDDKYELVIEIGFMIYTLI